MVLRSVSASGYLGCHKPVPTGCLFFNPDSDYFRYTCRSSPIQKEIFGPGNYFTSYYPSHCAAGNNCRNIFEKCFSVLGHATFCIVVVYNNVIARFRRIAVSQIEASMDLGANGFKTFRYIVLPNIATALLAGGMLAFALSFDEVIVTTFTAGQQFTLPMDAYGTDPSKAATRNQCSCRIYNDRHFYSYSAGLLFYT